MLKKHLVFILLLLLLITLNSISFSATETPELSYAGNFLKELGIIKGDNTGNLQEYKELTREEFVSIVLKVYKLKQGNSLKPYVYSKELAFSDVPKNHWAYNTLCEARYYGLTSGMGNNKFVLGIPIQYTELLAVLSRDMLGNDTSDFQHLYLESHAKGFASPGYLNGEKLVRGHVFELILRMLLTVEKSGPNKGELWGKDILKSKGFNYTRNDTYDYLYNLNYVFSTHKKNPLYIESKLSLVEVDITKLKEVAVLDMFPLSNKMIFTGEYDYYDKSNKQTVHVNRTYTIDSNTNEHYLLNGDVLYIPFRDKDSPGLGYDYWQIDSVYKSSDTFIYNGEEVDYYLVTGSFQKWDTIQINSPYRINLLLKKSTKELVSGWVITENYESKITNK